MLLGGVSLVVSCSDRAWDERPAGAVTQAIIRGTEDHADPAVVALVADQTPYCTGTVVAPRVVLTAAHCVAEGRPATVTIESRPIAVTSTRVHAAFEASALSHDVAAVFLEADAPTVHASFADAPAPGALVRSVGFGLAATDDSTLIKRTGFQRIARTDETSLRLEPAPALPCIGDSGGAVLDESDRLIAIVSSGDPGCTSYASGTLVSAHRAFIDDAIASQSRSDGGCSMTTATRGEGAPAFASLVPLGFFLRTSRKRRPKADQRGAVLVEMVLALPLLLLTYLSFLQIAQTFTAGLVMRHATVVVARYASVAYPAQVIPDESDRAGSSGGRSPDWSEAARRGLGPWADVVRVKDATVRLDWSRDGTGELESKVEYEYSCHIPIAKFIVCRDAHIKRTLQVRSPLHGAHYSL